VEHRQSRLRKLPTFNEQELAVLAEANGTARSIIDWASKSKMDKQQRRTFEVLTAEFILTFYNEAVVDPDHPLRTTEFLKEHQKLKKLSGRGGDTQSLIAFVHGPG